MPRLASIQSRDPSMTATIESLSRIGVKTGEDLLWLAGCGSNLATQANVSPENLEALLDTITQLYTATPRMASEVYCSWKEHVSILSTGCNSLDEALSKGIFTDEITELVGPSTSGKTQICLSMAVWTAQNDSTVAYIDSGGSLIPARLQEIHLQGRGPSRDRYKVLHNVRQFYSRDVDGLFDCLEHIEAGLNQAAGEYCPDLFWKRLRLVVVDSIGSIFAPVIGASGQHHVAFVVCNHTTGVPSRFGDVEQGALGQHTRTAKVRKTNKAKVGASVPFRITSKGVEDA